MSESRTEEPHVLIVGAGPVGLTAACELRRHGVNCLMIDQDEGPTPLTESRALGIWARTLEVLGKVGVVGRVLDEAVRVRGLNIYSGGRRLVHLDTDGEAADTPYPTLVALPQGQTERVLIDRLGTLGAGVAWRTRLTHLDQDDRGVTATLAGPDGATRTVRAGWLVGCDGARSAVRHGLGLEFKGAEYEELFLLADARIDWDLPHDQVHAMLQPGGGGVAAFPLPGPGRWRLVDATGVLETDDPEQIGNRFREVIRASGHPAATISDLNWTSAFRIHRRVADRFRVGRVFLAGDAAHIHSPAGGQGMNTGIQDVFNLAWKLALVDSGRASDRLLDSYSDERRPVALGVLRGTDLATRAITLRGAIPLAVRNHLLACLNRTGLLRRLRLMLSELNVAYRDSPIVGEDWPGRLGGLLPRSVGGGSGPRPGERAPDVVLSDEPGDGPRRLSEAFDGLRHELMVFPGDESPARLSAIGDLVTRAHGGLIRAWLVAGAGAQSPPAGWPGEVLHDPTSAVRRRYGADALCLYLIRPDGYVGYRASPPDPEKLRSYLDRLLGDGK
jgi:2-polyprenyl-6-methoxyphenol hydroxylase-like FAD-dependent oxidoreductase